MTKALGDEHPGALVNAVQPLVICKCSISSSISMTNNGRWPEFEEAGGTGRARQNATAHRAGHNIGNGAGYTITARSMGFA